MTSSFEEKIAKVKTAMENVFVKKSEIKNNLTSTDTDKPLSANQGNILNNDKISKDKFLQYFEDGILYTLFNGYNISGYGKEILTYSDNKKYARIYGMVVDDDDEPLSDMPITIANNSSKSTIYANCFTDDLGICNIIYSESVTATRYIHCFEKNHACATTIANNNIPTDTLLLKINLSQNNSNQPPRVYGTLTTPFTYTGDNLLIDWGDGTIETYTDGALDHTYKDYGEYIIKITGNITSINNSNSSNKWLNFGQIILLESVFVPSTVTSIGDYAFNNHKCKGIYLPNTITTFGNYCFFGMNTPLCPLKIFVLPPSVTTVGTYCFANMKNMEYIDITNLTGTLPNYCFYQCMKLQQINIPDTITDIGNSCFSECSNLKELNIPSSITSMGNNCFNRTGLTVLDFNWTNEEDILNYQSNWKVPTGCQIRVPSGLTELYENKGYSNIIERVV